MQENKTVVNLNVSILPCFVDDFNQCSVRIPVEELEIVLVIVLEQHSQTHTSIICWVLLPSNGQNMWLQSLDYCVWNLFLSATNTTRKKKKSPLICKGFSYSLKSLYVSPFQIVPPGSRQPVSEGLGAVPGQLQHRAPAPNNPEKGPAKTQALQRQLNQQHTLSNSVSHLYNAALTP